MRCLALYAVALFTLVAQPADARRLRGTPPPPPNDSTTGWVDLPAGQAKAQVDTLFPLGGPGTWEGTFETPAGQADWHGWTHEDVTLVDRINHWHVSTYWAEYIEGHGLGNHAFYCGDETIPACDPPDTIGGVGRGWWDEAEWRYTVADTSQPVTVRLTGLMNYDLPDAGWDFLELYLWRAGGSDLLESWTGVTDTTVILDFTTVISPGEYTGAEHDEVKLFWRVWTSEDGWDDEDCINPSHGACQIDDLSVYLDDYLITFDDFEPGNSVNWVPSDPSGVGDFTNLRNDLGEIDPCRDNNTWQVNFVDDGVVVPGTGGTPCYIWCYDPGGWMVNNTGGLLANDGDWFVNNQVISPPIAWPAGNDGAEFSFDVYRHESLTQDAAGVFYFWHVRSTDSADPADLELAPWRDRNRVYEGGPDFKRHDEPISDLLVPDRQWVQVAMGLHEVGWVWGWNGPNGTPAPYFDNVVVKAWDPNGPEIRVQDVNLFADAFPEAETLNPDDLEANWCRVDVQAITNTVAPRTILGDSLEAWVTPIRHGATVVEPPGLHWVLSCNPTFDSIRTEAPDDLGLLRGLVPGSVVLDFNGNPRENLWSFDLPDTGFFYPGDLLHYYLTASDDLAGDVRTSVWPPDTTGVLDFTLESVFPPETTVHALPTVTQPAAAQFANPGMLFCDFTADAAHAATWYTALQALGLGYGSDFDVMTIRKGGVNYGFESQTTLAHLSEYRTLVISTGSMSQTGLTGNEWSNDAKLVHDWLAAGQKQALLAGDDMAHGLSRSTDGYALLTQMGVSYYFPNITHHNGSVQEMQVSPVVGNGVLPEDTIWQVFAGCPDLRDIDAIGAQGVGQMSATLDPEGTPGGSFGALVTYDDLTLVNRTAVMPFDLAAVTGMAGVPGKGGASLSAQANLLEYLLIWIGADGASPAEDVPEIGQITVAAHPNPFNPQTIISFDLPRTLEVSLSVFDLQGRLVRNLLQSSPHTAGSHQQVWDGRDAEGQTAASGVYFFRFTAGEHNRVGKLTLLK